VIPKNPAWLADRTRYGLDKTGGLDEPWLTRGAITFLEGYLRPWMSVLEFGAGSSTEWFARRVKSVLSIESDSAWAESVQNDVPQATVRVVPPTAEAYAALRIDLPTFDFALVDGCLESRELSLRLSLEYVKPGGAIMVDNTENNIYLEMLTLMQGLKEHQAHNGAWKTSWWFV